MTSIAVDRHVPISGSKGIRVALWVVQGIAAVAFLMAGAMKVMTPLDKLDGMMPWVNGGMGRFVREIGVIELMGALGLLLPAATRIMPKLTVLAATGLTLLMLGAAATHVSRGEYSVMGVPLILGALTAFVAWGRSAKVPIAAR